MFGYHSHFPNHGHEIRVPIPTRDDMKMQVILHTGSCDKTQIEPHIKPFGFHQLL